MQKSGLSNWDCSVEKLREIFFFLNEPWPWPTMNTCTHYSTNFMLKVIFAFCHFKLWSYFIQFLFILANRMPGCHTSTSAMNIVTYAREPKMNLVCLLYITQMILPWIQQLVVLLAHIDNTIEIRTDSTIIHIFYGCIDWIR